MFGAFDFLQRGASPGAYCLQLLSSAVQKLPLHPPLAAFCPPKIASARAPKLASCFVSQAFCRLRCARCPPVWFACILSFLPSGLVSCIVSPATECKLPSILAFWAFICCSVKVALLCGILPCLNCIFYSNDVALVSSFLGSFFLDIVRKWLSSSSCCPNLVRRWEYLKQRFIKLFILAAAVLDPYLLISYIAEAVPHCLTFFASLLNSK